MRRGDVERTVAAALQQVKIRSTVDWYKEHLMPWLKK